MQYYDPRDDSRPDQEGRDGSAYVVTTGGATALIRGTATGGTSTTIQDTTKNFTTNMLAGKLIRLFSGSNEFIRSIVSNTANTFTTAELSAAVAASAVIGDAYDYEVTIVVAAAGNDGNKYTADVVSGEGADVDLSAVLADNIITVTLGTDAEGALDAAKNTGTLVAAAINALAQFTASVTGADGSKPFTTNSSISFSGGMDAYGGQDGDIYEIIDAGTQSVQLSGSNVADDQSIPIRDRSRLTYTEMDYIVVAVYENTLYGMDTTQKNLYKSTDNGDTWGSSIFTPPSTASITSAHLSSTGVLLLFCNSQKVYRSTDDVNFTEVLSDTGLPLPGGVDSNGDIICFCEYYNLNGATIAVRRSNDGGLTWAIVLDKFGATGVDHWHSCQYLHNVQRWITTTGDGPGILWYQSSDGITWENILNDQSQYYRTLGVFAPSVDRLVWSSDGTSGYEGVYSIEYLNRVRVRGPLIRVFLLPHTSYAFIGYRNLFIASSMVTVTNTNTYLGMQNPSIFISLDAGQKWQLDKEFIPASSGLERGIFAIIGPDAKGSFYFWCKNIEDGSIVTIKGEPASITVNDLSKYVDPEANMLAQKPTVVGTFTVPSGTTTTIFVHDWSKYRKGSLYVNKTSGSKALNGNIYAQWCDTESTSSATFGTVLPFDVDTTIASTRGLLFTDVKMPFIKVTVNNTNSADDMILVVGEKLQI